jgi:hypothetical protein
VPACPTTKNGAARHSRLGRLCLAAVAGVAVLFWLIGRSDAAAGAAAGLVGCLGLVLPPRERMASLPWRLRALPRRCDAAPALATLLSCLGYGLGWFDSPGPYDELVHLLNGGLAGAVFTALLRADGRRRTARGLTLTSAAFGLALGAGWEMFEWATGLIGNWTDTWTDVALTALGATLVGPMAAGRPSRPPAGARLSGRGGAAAAGALGTGAAP